MFKSWFGGEAAADPQAPGAPNAEAQQQAQQQGQQQQGGGWLGGWLGSGAQPIVPLAYPELPSPSNREEYEKEYALKKELFESLLKETDWRDIGFIDDEHPEVKVWDKILTDSNVHMVRASSPMPCPPHALANNLRCGNVPELKRWDPDLETTKVVEVIHREENHELDIVYQTYNAPFPIANRSFLCLRKYEKLPDGTIIIIAFGFNHNEFTEPTSLVRGALILAGWKISPVEGDPNSCFQDRVVQLDPKGLIPLMIVNLFKNKAGQSLVLQRKVFAGLLGPVPE